MANYKVYSEEEQNWITLPLAFRGEQGIEGEPGNDGITPLFKIEDERWMVSYDNGKTYNDVGSSTGLDSVKAVVDSSTGTPSATASYSGPEGARTLTFRFSGLKGETGPKGADGAPGKDGQDGTSSNRFEYIYTRRKDASVDVFPPTSVNEDGHIPSDDGYSWTRTPQGVSPEWEIEYVFFREKDHQTNIWGDWKDQGIWSEYGKVGRDGNGLEYIFKLTSSLADKPDKPVAPSNTDPESYPDTWSDNPLAVSEEMQCCWVSIRNQYYDDYGIQKWGAYSDPSPWAMYGKAGADGGRTVLMFIGTEEYTTTCPKALPIGGTWDIKTNSIIFNGNDTANGWTMSTPARTDKTRFVWQTYADFNGEGVKVTDWQSAICITGENGANGADGLSREYIYLLLPDKDVYGLLLDIYNDTGENNWLENTDTGVVPDPIEIGGIMYTWTDNPSGIDDVNNLVEVVCTRIHEENGWSNWSKPTYWAMWGEDGNDGPGVEYIFRVTSPINPNSEQPHMKTREAFAEFLHNELISWREAIGDTEYQKDEVYPSKFNLENYGYEIDWEDEPQDVDENQPLEWVSIRKKVDGVWQPYSMPKVWNVYAKDGISYKTSYVFTRSNETPVVPNGGSYDDPYPSNTINGERIWDDTVPSGTGIIWMSYRTFSNPDTNIDDDWSTPVKMSDTSTFQVEFTAQDIAEKLQSGYKPARIEVAVFDDAAENAWRESESAKGVTWGDDVADAVYMIMSTCYNGVWSDWTIIRIKGEKGDRGDDGTSVKIEGFFETEEQLRVEWNKHIDDDPDTHAKFVMPLENGDGYIINETGDLWVYSEAEDTNFEKNWSNVGQIKGPAGETSVVLFKTTTDDKAPQIPSGNTITSAEGWTTRAVSASADNPFIWYVVAKVVKDIVIEWVGDKDNPEYASLFTRHVYDGNHAMHLELTDDVGDVPVENGTVDPDFIAKNESIRTELILYYGDDVVQSNDDCPIIYSYSYIDAVGNTQIIEEYGQIFTLPLKDASGNARKVEDMPKSVLCTATYKGVPYKRTFHLRYSESPYKIEVSKTVLEKYPSDHEKAGYLVDSDKTVSVTVRKWLENTWTEIDGKNVFARCYHSDSTDFDVKEINLSEEVTFDFSNEKDLTSIMIYVTDDNTYGGDILSWQDLGVVKNGANGGPGAAGESMITSYVFRWYAATTDKPSPDAPTGGSFKTPLPDESDWSDTITENSDRVSTLWMSMRTFKSNDDNYQQGWSTPRRVADTSDFQFEFTKTDLSQFANYTPSTFTGDEQAWRTYEKDRGVEWLDQEKDALYMATAVCHNGIWADWKVTKIKGEKGDPGDPGSSVQFSGEFDTIQSLKEEWESYCQYMEDPMGDSIPFCGTLSQGNGYYVKEDGKLYIYSGGWSVGENPEFSYYWTGVQFKGNDGDDGVNGSILYVRYSNGKENDKWEFTSADGFDLGMAPGKYIGIYVYVPATDESDLSNDPSVYTWTLWKGEDGWGYEQVFVLAKAGKTPTIPISQNPYKDECPEIRDEDKDVVMGNNGNWSDIPMTPTQDYPTCYGIMRKVHGSEFGTWEGPFVYSTFSYDGKFEHFIVHNTMDQIYVGADNKTVVDQIFKTKVSINTQDGESPITSGQKGDFIITGLENITFDFNSITSEILFTIPKNTLVNQDLEVGIEYKGKTKTMLLKRIVGFTEYSLGTDNIFISKTNTRPKVYIVENVIGSGQSSKWENDIPSGYRITWKIDGTYSELVNVLESPVVLKSNQSQTASLWKGPNLVDQITFVFEEQPKTGFIVNNPVDQVYFSNYRFRSDLSIEYACWSFHIQKFEDGNHKAIENFTPSNISITANDINGNEIEQLTIRNLELEKDWTNAYKPKENNWFVDRLNFRVHNNLYVDLWHEPNEKFFDQLLKKNVQKVSKINFTLSGKIDNKDYYDQFTLIVLNKDEDYDIVCEDTLFTDTPTFNVTTNLSENKDIVYTNNTEGINVRVSKRDYDGSYDVGDIVPSGLKLTISKNDDGGEVTVPEYTGNNKINPFTPLDNCEYYIKLFKNLGSTSNDAIVWTLIDQVTVYPQRIEYDLKLDNTFAIVHLNPDDTIAEGQTITSGIKLFRAGVIQNIVEYSKDTNVGVNVVCDGNIAHELNLESGVLTLNPTKNKKLTNKVVTVEYYDKLGNTSYKVASATITLDVDRPFVDYDLSTSVKTITKKSDGTFNPSSFDVSILQKAVGSENILTEYHNVPNGYRVEYGTSGVINATEQLTEIIPNNNITDNIIPVKLIKTGLDGQDSIVVDRIDVAVIETSGKRGQMLYPAGVWDVKAVYTATDSATPYVEYIDANGVSQGYYILIKEDSNGITGELPTNELYWKKADGNFDTIFSKAIVAQYGNIGGAVYYSHTTSDNNTYEFLFSKSGKENDTIESAEYSDFMIDVETDDKGANKAVNWTGEQKLLDVILERSRFIPNTLICFTTGEAWYSGGSTKFYADSSSVAGIEYVDELVHYYPESITLVLDQESTDGGAIELTFENGMFDADGKYRYYDVKSNSDSYINVHGHNKGAQEWNNSSDSISFRNLVLICDVSEIKNEPGEILFSEAFVSYQSDNRTFETPKCYIRYVENDNTDNGIDYSKYDYITLPLKWADEQNISGTKDVKFQSLYKKGSETSGDMHVAGDLTVNKTLYYQDIQELSDERKKTFENSINVDFDKLASLRKSYFTYNDKPSVQKIGVSAQEIQRLYPEIVGTDPRGYLGVDYSKLSVIALKAIDQLHERVKYLEGVIESLSK